MLCYRRLRVCVRPLRNVIENNWLNLEAPFAMNINTLTKQIHLPIFIQIVSVLDFYFQGQRFELGAMGSSYVIISESVTYRANIANANT